MNLDPGIRRILEELRELRLEMRADRRQADAERRQAKLDSDERFEKLMRAFQKDSDRRETATRMVFKDVRAVGLSIVKTLNHNTRILERIDRRLGARGNGLPGLGNGRSA